MKEQISRLSGNLKALFEIHSEEVAENYVYLQSIGISNPELLINIAPELFITPNEDVRNMTKNINVAKVNDNPLTIIDMIE